MSNHRSTRQRKALRKKIVIGSIIGALFLAFLSCLGLIVLIDNQNKCGELGLDANLAGCVDNAKYQYDSVAFVIGNTANSPMPNMLSLDGARTKDSIEQYLANSRPNSTAIFSVASGTSTNVKNSQEEVASIDDLQSVLDNLFHQVNDAFAQSPTADGADYFDTIRKAARHARSQADDKALVIVIGSGLSDRGELNIAEANFFDGSACAGLDLTVLDRKLEPIKNNFIEDSLLGVDIVWYGLGQTVAPQSSLGRYDEYLKYIYENFFEYLGANIKFIDSELSGESIENTNGHTVKETSIPGTISIIADNESELGFNANTADFRDRAAAKAQLASSISFCPDTKIVIEGYVARQCGESADQDLSQQRADATKALILEIASETGNPTPFITAVGKGKGPYDECTGGYFNESIASQNRYTSIKVSQGK